MNRTMSLADTTTGELLTVPTMYQNMNQFESDKMTSVGDVPSTSGAVYLASPEPLISTSTQFPNIGNENQTNNSPMLSAQLSAKDAGTNPLRRNSIAGKFELSYFRIIFLKNGYLFATANQDHSSFLFFSEVFIYCIAQT